MLKKIFTFGVLSAVTAFGVASSPVGAQELTLTNTQGSAQIGAGNVDFQQSEQNPVVLDVIPGGAEATKINAANNQTSGQVGAGNLNIDRSFQNPLIVK